jgi:hypothetical protein
MPDIRLDKCEGNIVVSLTGDGGGSISSNLYAHPDDDDFDPTEDNGAYNWAIEGMESLLLACACEGIDVTSDQFQRAVQSAIEGIANNA